MVEDSIPQSRRADYTALIDGYNVIKRHPAWKRAGAAEGRARLIRHLGILRWPVPVTRTVIVFDGPSESLQRITATLQVRFAAPSADAWIQDTIRASRSPSRLLLVSDDRDILTTAKSHGTLCYPTTWLV